MGGGAEICVDTRQCHEPMKVKLKVLFLNFVERHNRFKAVRGPINFILCLDLVDSK